MNEKEFKDRTKDVALRVIRLTEALPKNSSAQILGRQLLRSAASIGANYRAACRGKSTADFLHKLAIVEEEADESLYWLELLAEADIVSENRLTFLINDIQEIVAMTVASIKTLRARSAGKSSVSDNSSNASPSDQTANAPAPASNAPAPTSTKSQLKALEESLTHDQSKIQNLKSKI